MQEITKKQQFYSPAKINLYLKILNKRPDNYHNIISDLVPIDFWDSFTIKPAKQKQLIKNYKLANDKDLNWKAICLLEEKVKKQFHFSLEIKKIIPSGAGLGGASSNAAAILFVLNRLLQLDLSFKELLKMARQLGADVPFFLYQQQTRIGGIGDKVKAYLDIPCYPLIIFKPPFSILTSEAYANFQFNKLDKAAKNLNLDYLANFKLQNDLYNSAKKSHPQLLDYLDLLYSTNPLAAQMSGSGSSLFAIYKNITFRELAYQKLHKKKAGLIFKSKILQKFNFFTKS